jgi:hypothetical protein
MENKLGEERRCFSPSEFSWKNKPAGLKPFSMLPLEWSQVFIKPKQASLDASFLQHQTSHGSRERKFMSSILVLVKCPFFLLISTETWIFQGRVYLAVSWREMGLP